MLRTIYFKGHNNSNQRTFCSELILIKSIVRADGNIVDYSHYSNFKSWTEKSTENLTFCWLYSNVVLTFKIIPKDVQNAIFAYHMVSFPSCKILLIRGSEIQQLLIFYHNVKIWVQKSTMGTTIYVSYSKINSPFLFYTSYFEAGKSEIISLSLFFFKRTML